MSDNPILSALIDSAQSGDTYSAWTSFKAFLTRRLRSPALRTNIMSTYAMLTDAMEKAAAPTLDGQMAADLSDALLEAYRRGGDTSLRGDAMTAMLAQWRQAFREAADVVEKTAVIPRDASATAVAEIRLGDVVAPTVLSASETAPSATASSSPAPSSPQQTSLEARIAQWLEARAAFAEKVLAELLKEIHTRSATPGPTATAESATVKDWIACYESEDARDPQPFTAWVCEASEARVKVMLAREMLFRRVRAAGTRGDDTSACWHELVEATEKAMRWSVHSRSVLSVTANLSCVVRFLLTRFGCSLCVNTQAPHAPSPDTVRQKQMELLAKLVYHEVFRRVVSARPGAFLDEVVTTDDVPQLWKVFPISIAQMRATAVPVCLSALKVCQQSIKTLPHQSDASALASTETLESEARFLAAVLTVVQNTPAAPRETRVQQAYVGLIHELCVVYGETLVSAGGLNWEGTLCGL